MKCAIYCRLSKEDESSQEDSESIRNQKDLLLDYAASQNWQVYRVYCDEDYSGVDLKRPQFRQLLQDAEKNKFQIVLCKTQSRFTRDMEIVEHYIHYKFILWGIRFVALLDHADSALKGNKKSRQINGLINEWYLEDLSENIKAVFAHKRKTGQYLASFPLYGYCRDERDKQILLIDEEAALVVKKIYDLYLEGLGKQAITDYLNQAGIVNPTAYKRQKGQAYENGKSSLWNKTTVGRILKNEMYIGTLVQGKRYKPSYKSKKVIELPPERWVRIPHHHAAIIEPQIFALVQEMLSKRVRSDGLGKIHLLAGKVRCSQCGNLLKKRTNSKGKSSLFCVQHRNVIVDVDDLTALTKQQIICLLNELPPPLIKGFQELKMDKDSMFMQKQIDKLQQEMANRQKALKLLYLDYAAGKIKQADFYDLSGDLETEKNSFARKLQKMQAKAAASSLKQDYPKINRDLVSLLLDNVVLGKQQQDQQEVFFNWLF
ncbi:MAG: recombinase family protein [Bacillota bacterium]|jgi:site-specific DNA recombinase